jgi:shikimate dehydrogenase
MTDRYAVIGHPVAHSMSPQIHAAFALSTQQDMHYERLLAPLDGFAATVREFRAQGGCGANVTLPFKQEAFALCDALSARARSAGAVNTLHWVGDVLHGDNTDGAGLVQDLACNLGQTLKSARILLLGAGGAARGVLLPLLAEQPAVVVIANRTEARARELAAMQAGARAATFAGLAGERFDVVINATSASLGGELPPLPEGLFTPGSLAYDMMYGKGATPFMDWAGRHGASRVADGLGMLVEQAAEAFFIWRGVRPDTAPVLAGLRQAAGRP